MFENLFPLPVIEMTFFHQHRHHHHHDHQHHRYHFAPLAMNGLCQRIEGCTTRLHLSVVINGQLFAITAFERSLFVSYLCRQRNNSRFVKRDDQKWTRASAARCTKHNSKLNLWGSYIRSFTIKDVETKKLTLPDFNLCTIHGMLMDFGSKS
uniref:Uncharacterized protein n=1 Tax=Glossina pallidipes TaxID=7398 RepID=A0A1A9ZQ72_GLOPL